MEFSLYYGFYIFQLSSCNLSNILSFLLDHRQPTKNSNNSYFKLTVYLPMGWSHLPVRRYIKFHRILPKKIKSYPIWIRGLKTNFIRHLTPLDPMRVRLPCPTVRAAMSMLSWSKIKLTGDGMGVFHIWIQKLEMRDMNIVTLIKNDSISDLWKYDYVFNKSLNRIISFRTIYSELKP